ncbi:MAG: threonine--tRNA ligase [bacterium]
MSRNNKQSLETLRHTLSHVLMQALARLYGAIPGVGPAIENGFYHDIDIPAQNVGVQNFEPLRNGQISLEDLPKIEKEMRKIIAENLPIEKKNMPIDEGIKFLKDKGYAYTAELAKDLKAEGENAITFFQQGEFINMCKGPHLASTGEINPDAFKLTKLAGAYWKGDEKNKMLQRVYGVAFESKNELDEYLKMLEEAEKRDHRKLGKELDLFLVDPIVGLGLALWQPKGALLWRIMEDFWYQEHLKAGYELVRTPHIGNRKLWETSGHWGFYSGSMYPPLEVGQNLEESKEGKKAVVKEEYLLKPMNCPFHVVIYNSKPHSYRELPIRWAECGTVYRYEKSGELSGLTRVRGFTQDDAHIICTKEQVEKELKRVIDFIIFMFKSFGFNEYKVYLSVRDPENGKYAGSNEGWDFTEKTLEKVAKEKNLDIEKDIGGAVFYGPKLDFKIKDSIGREWQCSTLQFDFNLPERFDMSFINREGGKERPYMLHRALFGSFERFIGVLIEHYAGAFPVWLSPVQVKIISVGEKHIEYCQKLADEFRTANIRVEVDSNNETVGNKIRKAREEKIPYVLVIGDKEIASDESRLGETRIQGEAHFQEKKDSESEVPQPRLHINIRGQKEIVEMGKNEFIERVKKEIMERK